MPIRVIILGRDTKMVEYRPGMRVADILKELGLLSTEYVAVKNGRVVSEEEELSENDEVTLVPVVSGG
ncbi:MAG: MoaD/ThiS family protein [Thermoproteota archaeon]